MCLMSVWAVTIRGIPLKEGKIYDAAVSSGTAAHAVQCLLSLWVCQSSICISLSLAHHFADRRNKKVFPLSTLASVFKCNANETKIGNATGKPHFNIYFYIYYYFLNYILSYRFLCWLHKEKVLVNQFWQPFHSTYLPTILCQSKRGVQPRHAPPNRLYTHGDVIAHIGFPPIITLITLPPPLPSSSELDWRS